MNIDFFFRIQYNKNKLNANVQNRKNAKVSWKH